MKVSVVESWSVDERKWKAKCTTSDNNEKYFDYEGLTIKKKLATN